MGRVLDTPIDQADLGYQCIDGIRFEIPHSWNGSTMVLNRNSIYVSFNITNYDTAGIVLNRQGPYTVKFADWNATFTSNANSIYQTIEAYCDSQGIFVGVGTTEPI